MQLKLDHHLMDNIERDYPTDCEQCCCKMLAEWLGSSPSACWEDLTAAVDNLLSYGKCVYKHNTALLDYLYCTCML